MKRLIVITLALGLLLSGSAAAQDGPPRQEGANHRPKAERGPPARVRGLAGPPQRSGPVMRSFRLDEPPQAGRVENYARHRLRPPPRGFAWVRTGQGYALVSLANGRVYDIIPD